MPQKKRQQLVHEFQRDPDCQLFLTTNAGSTGLNLQAANTVINVDLPWNPAVLEQRIARAHRMGQKRPVQVYVLVTEETIEENLLATLAAKHDLALAALDPGVRGRSRRSRPAAWTSSSAGSRSCSAPSRRPPSTRASARAQSKTRSGCDDRKRAHRRGRRPARRRSVPPAG